MGAEVNLRSDQAWKRFANWFGQAEKVLQLPSGGVYERMPWMLSAFRLDSAAAEGFIAL